MSKSENREETGGKRIPWLRMALALLALILLAEAAFMAIIWKTSDSAAVRMGQIDHAAEEIRIRGVSLCDGGDEPVVDGALLTSIAALHKTGIDSVRLPLDFVGHMDDGVIDGVWMGRAASMMEMIYQSNYRVIVSAENAGINRLTPIAYMNLWKQIDAAWGHRPASEMLYELRAPQDADPDEWIESARMILLGIREKNADRKVLFTIAPDVWTKKSDAIVALCGEHAVYVGLIAGAGTGDDLLQDMQGIDPGRIVLIEPDGEAGGFAPASESVKRLAEQHRTGYLIRDH